jgi:hypothetical protein
VARRLIRSLQCDTVATYIEVNDSSPPARLSTKSAFFQLFREEEALVYLVGFVFGVCLWHGKLASYSKPRSFLHYCNQNAANPYAEVNACVNGGTCNGSFVTAMTDGDI